MKKNYLKLFIILCFVIILYYISLELLWGIFSKHFPTRRNISLGIVLYYNKFVFSTIVIISVYISSVISNKTMRLFSISLMFMLYFVYWYSALLVYPYRVLSLLSFSMFFYINLHLYIWRYIKFDSQQ